MAKIPKELIKKPGRTPGLAGDIIDLLFGGETIDPSDLIAPLGMARIGRSGSKFIDLFVGKEGRIHDINPTNSSRYVSHDMFVRDKFGTSLSKFINEGGVRGTDIGLEFAVDKAGKPKPGKQTLDRSLQTLLRSYSERGLSPEETIFIDKVFPSGESRMIEISLIDALKHRF